MFCRILMCSNVLVRRKYSCLSKCFLIPIQKNQELHNKLTNSSTLLSSLPVRNYHLTNYRLSNSALHPQGGLANRKSVEEFISRLTEDEKTLLFHSLRFENPIRKAEYDLWLEHHHYLTKFGRPSTHPLTTIDEPVLNKGDSAKSESESSSKATSSELWAVGLKNALPFVGFGFLDNLIMILAGDYIDMTIGTVLGISTMAAAALGNTVSDVAGIASAWYVEKFAERVGIREPQLTSTQLMTWQVRWSTTTGRAIGVIIGCLLGMIPLLFLPMSEGRGDKEHRGKSEPNTASTTTSTDKS